MKSQTTKGNENAKEQAASVAEMTEAFRQTCEQALRTGLKFQEESGRWSTAVFNSANCVQNWQEQLKAVTHTANSLLPLVQKPIGEIIDLAEKNRQSSADLMKKAMNASRACGLAESQPKWSDFWTTSLGAVQANNEALTQISSRMLDSWADFMQKTTEPRTFKSA